MMMLEALGSRQTDRPKRSTTPIQLKLSHPSPNLKSGRKTTAVERANKRM